MAAVTDLSFSFIKMALSSSMGKGFPLFVRAQAELISEHKQIIQGDSVKLFREEVHAARAGRWLGSIPITVPRALRAWHPHHPRCSNTHLINGNGRAVSYTSDDRLCLDGRRVIQTDINLGGGSFVLARVKAIRNIE